LILGESCGKVGLLYSFNLIEINKMNKEQLIRELYCKYDALHRNNLMDYHRSGDVDYLRKIDNEVMNAVYDVVKKYVECKRIVCESK